MYVTVWLTDRSGSLTTLSCNRTAVVVSCLTTFSLVNPDLDADRVAIHAVHVFISWLRYAAKFSLQKITEVFSFVTK